MNPHSDTASALLVGTTLGGFSFGQESFTLNFSRWSRQVAFGQQLPFEIVLEARGDIQFHGSRTWEDWRSSRVGSDEAILASLLVQLCQSGDAAVVNDVGVSGEKLELLFPGGNRVVVQPRPGTMGPDWVVANNPPGLPPTTTWSVFSEGGVIGSKRP
jgi:hypothetical protein